MADGNALFSAPHGNLMPASDLTATSLATASAALASQTVDGRTLHLPARYLVVGTLLGASARQLVTTMTPANSLPDTGLVVVQDGRIPGKDWYVMMDAWPTIATAHLATTGGPELLSREIGGRATVGCTRGATSSAQPSWTGGRWSTLRRPDRTTSWRGGGGKRRRRATSSRRWW